jgi:acetyl-CoA acetyltransferase family protein
MAAYIVSVARSAAGKNKGRLSHFHPADLGAAVVNSLVNKIPGGFDTSLVDDVIFGCVSQVGTQAANIGRNVVLASELPVSVPGTSVDRQCGSSQQAIHFAAQAVMSGTQDIVIAGGVEVMTTIPMMSNLPKGLGKPNSNFTQSKFGKGGFYSQFTGAELVAQKYSITREDCDQFAARSHRLAAAATAAGKFKDEIVVLEGFDKNGNPVVHDTDEGIRAGTTVERLATLDTLVSMGVCPPVDGAPLGVCTAGNASQISDGAAAVLIVNDAGLKKLGSSATPLARIHSLAVAGSDPVVMLAGPIPATLQVLQRGGLTMGDMDLYEVNEAFACVPLAWEKELGADREKLNVNGGACALGHPLGGTGAKLMTTLVNELHRSGKRYGLQAICEGGGTANATIIERC